MGDNAQLPRILKIRGCDVHFPHKPYPSQLAMMDKIIQALRNSQNVLLELPTGSGKSLSLLCAAAAWHASAMKELEDEVLLQKSVDENPASDVALALSETCLTHKNEKAQQNTKKDKPKGPPKVYIASRTHSQLAQLVREVYKLICSCANNI
jgi:Rad3-related DNA helicase